MCAIILYYSRKQESVNGNGKEKIVKDRKTILYFMIPLMIFALGAGGNLLVQVFQREPAPAQQIREEAGKAKPEELRIDLNKGTLEEFLRIPGIGEIKAQRIMEYRTEHGRFRSLEELLEIDGIGEKQLEQLKDYVWVEE